MSHPLVDAEIPLVADLLAGTLEIIREAGGLIAPTTRLIERDGQLSLESSADDGSPMLRIPRECFVRVDRVTWAEQESRMVIVEVSESMPWVCGEGTGVHVSEVDYIIEGDNQPAPVLPNPPASEVDIAVGKLIAAEIEDGSCLQIGIGGMPNAVCEQLLHSNAKDLGVHSEMLTEGMMALYHAGKITNARKQLHTGKMAFSFGLGSQAYYDSLHRNPDMACLPVAYTNLPHVIMRNHRVVAINNTTQMDLQGQAASESDGFRHISGTGGQLQFVRGAYASEGGKSFMCLSSTYEKHGVRKSRIALSLTPGNMVTTPRTDMMYVVTEYGIVNLKGKSVPERALALISIAHPDFRESLMREAYTHRLIPHGVSFVRH